MGALIIKGFVLFAFGALVDIVYVFWFHNVSINRPYQAAAASMLVTSFSLFGYVSVFEQHWLAVPYLLGVGTGVVVGIALKQRFSPKHNRRVGDGTSVVVLGDAEAKNPSVPPPSRAANE